MMGGVRRGVLEPVAECGGLGRLPDEWDEVTSRHAALLSHDD